MAASVPSFGRDVTHPPPSSPPTRAAASPRGCTCGHAVVVDPAGRVVRAWGDPDHVIFPRSSQQARAGGGHGRGTASTCPTICSRSPPRRTAASAPHRRRARVLPVGGPRRGGPADAAGLPAGRPWSATPGSRTAGGRPRSAMNCSGKHAAMLLTCVVNGWPIATYRDAGHPLQHVDPVAAGGARGRAGRHVGVDGCGAPVMSLSLAGLARSLSRAVQEVPGCAGRPGRRAMARFPDFVGRDRSRRDGLHAGGAGPGGQGRRRGRVRGRPAGRHGIALKVDDGSDRARQVALAAILVTLGVDGGPRAWRRWHLLGGGAVVGEVFSPLR